MFHLHILLGSILLLVFALLSQADDELVVNNPIAANFLRRAYHASIVLGDFLYIDGGQISQLVDGKPNLGQNNFEETFRPPGYHPGAYQNNITLSIDLRESWTTSTLKLVSIPKGTAPVLNRPVLWKGSNGSVFYSWAGEVSPLTFKRLNIPNSIWQFSGDGLGSGSWSEVAIAKTTVSSFLRPGDMGCSANFEGVGYQVGGFVSQRSDKDATPQGRWKDTISTFNTSSHVWTDERQTSLGSEGTMLGGSMTEISAIGLDNRGLLVVLGGGDPETNTSNHKEYTSRYYPFSNVTIYDPYIDVWFAQTATGEIPEVRESFCLVTIPGNNGTYEIFMFGGWNRKKVEVYDDVYILSIPGFVWFKSPTSRMGSKRFEHTCELVGSSQVIMIGGLDNQQDVENTWYDFIVPDPLVQGIGVFDLAAMSWKSEYNTNATAYISPQVVRSWYSAGNQASVQWQSLELARMFIRDVPVLVKPTPAAAISSSFPEKGNSGKDKSTIIGVVAGLGSFLVAILVALFGVYKHYRKKVKTPTNDGMSMVPQQISAETIHLDTPPPLIGAMDEVSPHQEAAPEYIQP